MYPAVNVHSSLIDILIPMLRLGLVIFFASSFLVTGIQFFKQSLPSPLENILKILARCTYLLGIAFLGAYSVVALIMGHESHLTVMGVCLVLSIFALSIEKNTNSLRFAPILTCIAASVVWFVIVLTFGLLPHTGNPNGAYNSGVGALSTLLTMTHIGSALLGEGLCILAFCSSALYLWVYWVLKKKPATFKYPLPTIQTLDKATDNMIFIGWFLMTGSLLSGFVLVMETGSAPFSKMIWACCVWVWYLATVLGRSAFGWRGRRGAWLALIGALLLFIPLFGSIWAGGGSHVAY